MLGVRRTSVSLVANTLQSAGLIRYSRGHIEITNLEGLREISCECYATVKTTFRQADRPRSQTRQHLRFSARRGIRFRSSATRQRSRSPFQGEVTLRREVIQSETISR